ncbi:hypothetical protein [Massilia glaciei]|nr:hypothetical protein [Massilia glaciei]
MTITLGLRALGLVAFVAASTTVIVAPHLFGGASAKPALHSVAAFGHA